MKLFNRTRVMAIVIPLILASSLSTADPTVAYSSDDDRIRDERIRDEQRRDQQRDERIRDEQKRDQQRDQKARDQRYRSRKQVAQSDDSPSDQEKVQTVRNMHPELQIASPRE